MMVRKALTEGEADLLMLAVHAALDGKPLAERSDSWASAELTRLFARPAESPSDVGCAFLLPAFRQGGLPAVRAAVAALEGAWARCGQVADWAWSTDACFEQRLLDVMGEVAQELPDPRDAESTAIIEGG